VLTFLYQQSQLSQLRMPNVFDEAAVERFVAEQDRRVNLGFLGGVVAGAGLFALWYVVPGAELRRKVTSLNPLRGRAKAEVWGLLGAPNGVQYGEDDRLAATWATHRYTVTLLFRGEVCEGVAGEYAD
jgi:hypothetical protein